MATITRVATDQQAAALADLLNGNTRTRPVVVVTIPAGRSSPLIDVEEIAEQVGDLAEVYLIATGPHTWTFSNGMPAQTQVYGGAGRVYPVGHEWISNVRRSPLRFAFDADEGQRSTGHLISDALGMAAAAGLMNAQPSPNHSRRTGKVELVMAERAMVRVDRELGAVTQQHALPGVPLDRVVSCDMVLEGVYDSATRWFDIRSSLLEPAVALASYTAGDVVLGEVHQVEEARATLFLHPYVVVEVGRADVTSNPLDDLRTLLTPGEVVPARLLDTAPDWRVTLIDVDDDELPRAAASLLPDGPPWLDAPFLDPVPAPAVEEALPQLPEIPDEADTEPEPTERLQEPVAAALPVPTPAMLDRKRHAGAPAESSARQAEGTPSSSSAISTMQRTIDALKSEVARLRRDLDKSLEQVRGLTHERELLARVAEGHQQTIARHEHELQQARSRVRRLSRTKPRAASPEPEFADPELGFRHAVLRAWARRTPTAEQASRPLGHFLIGPEFLDSVEGLQGVPIEKIADVVFEIVTDRAHELDGRDLHQLRENESGSSPYVHRTTDGATAWRAALQRNTPQARRIHFWRLTTGEIELWRVELHDDVNR